MLIKAFKLSLLTFIRELSSFDILASKMAGIQYFILCRRPFINYVTQFFGARSSSYILWQLCHLTFFDMSSSYCMIKSQTERHWMRSRTEHNVCKYHLEKIKIIWFSNVDENSANRIQPARDSIYRPPRAVFFMLLSMNFLS